VNPDVDDGTRSNIPKLHCILWYRRQLRRGLSRFSVSDKSRPSRASIDTVALQAHRHEWPHRLDAQIGDSAFFIIIIFFLSSGGVVEGLLTVLSELSGEVHDSELYSKVNRGGILFSISLAVPRKEKKANRRVEE